MFLETQPVENLTDRPDGRAELRAAASVHVENLGSISLFHLYTDALTVLLRPGLTSCRQGAPANQHPPVLTAHSSECCVGEGSRLCVCVRVCGMRKPWQTSGWPCVPAQPEWSPEHIQAGNEQALTHRQGHTLPQAD